MMLIAGGGKDLPPPDMTVTTLTLEDAEAIGNIERHESAGIYSPWTRNWIMQ